MPLAQQSREWPSAGNPGLRSPGRRQAFQKTIARFADQQLHAFPISAQAAGRPIGWCALAHHDTISRRVELAVMIVECDCGTAGDVGVGRMRAWLSSMTGSSFRI